MGKVPEFKRLPAHPIQPASSGVTLEDAAKIYRPHGALDNNEKWFGRISTNVYSRQKMHLTQSSIVRLRSLDHILCAAALSTPLLRLAGLVRFAPHWPLDFHHHPFTTNPRLCARSVRRRRVIAEKILFPGQYSRIDNP
jgi:hypothetical protein